MTFNSAVFLLFLCIFLAGWKVLARRLEYRWLFLTLASFAFYGWWNWVFLSLLIGTGTVDFLLGRWMGRTMDRSARKLILTLSVTSNLGILFAFKYSQFFAETWDRVAGHVGFLPLLAPRLPAALLVLPIGISFYTFESLSYIIDIYRGHLKPARSYFQFFAFLSMFPRLVSGPIERPANLLPQLLSPAPVTEELRWRGLCLIAQGYFKKTVIADNMAPAVNSAFAASASLATLQWWMAMTAFSIQIYCDFSGYSDIARGLANWMGFDFRLNFNNPYSSAGFSEFWQRWHVSLSSWFRDYVYIPLGGNRMGPFRSHMNAWATMLLSGFWHGAQWTFLAWGAVHAALLSAERITGWPSRISRLFGGRVACVLLTFLLTTTAWVFFRAPTIGKAFEILGRLFIPARGEFVWGGQTIALFLVVFSHEIWRTVRPYSLASGPLQRIQVGTLLVLSVFARGPGSTFIYFQF